MRRACIGLLACVTAMAAQAGEYPERPVRVIVTFPAGGGTDIVARMVMQKLAERTGGSFVIDNRGGAGGTIGTDLLAKAPADGYTIGVISGSHTINPALYKKLSFDSARDFAPVAMLVTGPGLLVVHPSLPARNVRELVVLARAQRGNLLYASAGNGTPPHLAAELFKLMTQTQIGHVPYKGNAQALTDLIGGQTAMSFPTIPSALPHVQTSKLRALGVTSAKRVGALPDMPAIAETVTGYDASAWYGVLAPAGTPPVIIARLHAELTAALRAPDLKDKLLSQGLEPASYTPEEFSALIVSELAKWAKVVAAAGIKNE
jgi:tripartite-type tricarboxylate transporter receptor subunit TctC